MVEVHSPRVTDLLVFAPRKFEVNLVKGSDMLIRQYHCASTPQGLEYRQPTMVRQPTTFDETVGPDAEEWTKRDCYEGQVFSFHSSQNTRKALTLLAQDTAGAMNC